MKKLNTVHLLVGHGSPLAAGNQEIRDFTALLQSRLSAFLQKQGQGKPEQTPQIELCFIEHAEPELTAAVPIVSSFGR